MFFPKLKNFRQPGGLLLVSLAVVVGSVSLFNGQLGVANQAKDSKTAEQVTTLLKTRVAVAEKAYVAAEGSFGEIKRIGNMSILVTMPEEIYTWSVRWLHAERDMNPKKADQITALERHLARMTALEKKVKTLIPEILPQPAGLGAEWYRLEAELWLAQAKANN